MEFRIADTFTDSLARLTGDEQKAVKTTAFDLQLDPANPGMSFHNIDRAKGKNFWSVRVNSDLRLIVHRVPGSLLLCYVDHHDRAYAWAEHRKLETHPKTGAAQLVEIRETVQEILIPAYVEVPQAAPAKQPLFAHLSDDALLSFGVPMGWLPDARRATEDTLLVLADHLPGEAAEALLELATGGKPRARPPVPAASNPFGHPDAQRRFRVVSDVEELSRALEYPWDKWTVFLHPAQRELVERRYGGPARISGSAGTGKSIVALHRAVSLARANPDARVLLTTFSGTLANALQAKLTRLIGTEPRLGERVEVDALDAVARRLYQRTLGRAQIASGDVIRDLLRDAACQSPDQKFSLSFLVSEWAEVVDAWQLASWEAYRDVARLGRKTRLPEKQRQALWAIFERVRAALAERGLMTEADLCSRLAAHLAAVNRPPYDFVVVDEAQDVSVAQLRFVAALGGERPDSLFFTGDLGQRIFQSPFSWKSLGVDIRGRAGTLRINYRTSHQIRARADRLLGQEVTDVDGNTEDRGGTISVFNGPLPALAIPGTVEEEAAVVSRWLADRVSEGLKPEEMAVFVRSTAQLPRARAAVEAAGLPSTLLDENVETTPGYVAIGTMHLSKGLEFRAVVVMACDDDVVPLQARIETVTDDSDLQEVYDTERHLLYVACTRARDHLLVTGVDPNRTRELAAAVLRQCDLKLAGRSVIEVGCGTGRNTFWLAKRAASVLALDISEGMLRQAKAYVQSPLVRFLQHDIRFAWPVADASTDVVIAMLVLEHVEHLDPILTEASRALRPNGDLFLCELHPMRQMLGRQAQFTNPRTGELERVAAVLHDVSEYVNGGVQVGCTLLHLGEWRDAGAARADPPRLLSVHFRMCARAGG